MGRSTALHAFFLSPRYHPTLHIYKRITDFTSETTMPEQSTENHILYDAEFFMSYEVSGIISNTNNGIIYRAVSKNDGRNVVIKQINKKMLKYFYQIHGQPCPAEFVYHFTASAGEGGQYMVKPIEWLEGMFQSVSLLHIENIACLVRLYQAFIALVLIYVVKSTRFPAILP